MRHLDPIGLMPVTSGHQMKVLEKLLHIFLVFAKLSQHRVDCLVGINGVLRRLLNGVRC